MGLVDMSLTTLELHDSELKVICELAGTSCYQLMLRLVVSATISCVAM